MTDRWKDYFSIIISVGWLGNLIAGMIPARPLTRSVPMEAVVTLENILVVLAIIALALFILGRR